MASTLNEIQPLRLYNKQMYLPVDDNNRKEESAIFLLTPNFNSSMDLLRQIYKTDFTGHKGTFVGNSNWESYYMEKDIMVYINNESHTLSRIDNQIIDEDGEIKIQVKEKGKLSEFKRVDITEQTLEEHIAESDKVCGIVEYFPWTGYFYLTEDEKLVAGINVNIEEKTIQRLFVTNEKYSYLYKELIEEARKMKANSIILDKNDESIQALTEFGFSKVEDYDDRIKMQFRVPIDEAVEYYGANRKLVDYVKSMYYPKGDYDKDYTKALLDVCEYYGRRMHLNLDICFLMGQVYTSSEYRGKIIYNDLRLREYIDEKEIAIALNACKIVHDDEIKIESIYARVLHDACIISHYTDTKVVIRDAVDWYFEEYDIDDREFLYQNEVEIIEERIKQVHQEGNGNDWILKISYTYYRDKGYKLKKDIKKGLTNKIQEMYHVRVDTSLQNEAVANILNESHISFGYRDENFIDNIDDEILYDDSGFRLNEGTVNAKRGIIIREGETIQGVVRVNDENLITEMYSNTIDPQWLVMAANRKYLANKAKVPEKCIKLIKAFDTSHEWDHVYDKDGYKFYDLSPNAECIPYPDIGIDENCRNMYNRLDDKSKGYLGNQYLNEVCITNTIYRKVYNEIGLVDLYINPIFPKIAFIDIAVLENQRRKGKASMMIQETMEVVKKSFPKIDMIGWTCKDDNDPSYNLALKNGFTPHTEKNGFKTLFYHIHTPEANIFTEDSLVSIDDTYTNDISMSSRGLNLENCLNHDGYHMILEEDLDVLEENDVNGNRFKRMLWDDRIKNNKDVLRIYKRVKEETDNHIKYTFLDLALYKKKNLFVDLSFYVNSYFNNIGKANMVANEKAINELFFDFMKRIIKDNRISSIYHKRTVFIPIDDWCKEDTNLKGNSTTRRNDYWENLSPIGCLLYMIHRRPELVEEVFRDIDFVFISEIGFFFKISFDRWSSQDEIKFRRCCDDLLKKVDVPKDNTYGKKAMLHVMLDRLENSPAKVKINSINAQVIEDPDKKKLVKKIEDSANKASTPEDAAKEIDNDGDIYTKKLLEDIVDREPGNVKISAARSKRMDTLTNNFLNQKVSGKNFQGTMSDYMHYNAYTGELKSTDLHIDNINQDWKEMRFTNFEKHYNLRADIYAILYHFDKVSARLVIRAPIDIKDTSTSEDWKETWTVPFETDDGKRFSFKFDIPLLKDNRNMVIGGNDKTINGQLVLLPISKTDEDTVQIVTNYNKIFIRRFSNGECKSNRDTDKLAKTIDIFHNNHKNGIKVKFGNSNYSNSKYNLPFDYVDLSNKYYSISMLDKGKIVGEIYFNQDIARQELGLKPDDNRMPIGWYEKKSNIIFYDEKCQNDNLTCASVIADKLCNHSKEFMETYQSIKPSNRHTYSKASILATEIPVVVIMAYSEGLQTTLKKAHIKYELSEKRQDKLKLTHDVIKFRDCYMYYEDNYISSMLMNGLKELDLTEYSIRDTDNKNMWTEILDHYGGRIKADGLDNFYDLMMDPINVEVCEYFKLPTDYCELLAYANLLLADNEYTKHTDLASNRYRTNELIAAKAYKCISTAYANYRMQKKKDRHGAVMTMKQSAIIDALMEESTLSDLSILNPLLEIEAKNTVSFKGHVGMNSDRSYSLDKRTYDPSMINKIAMSTGFAGNVGVNRQTTLNMNIVGTRGYIKNTTIDQSSVANTLSATEALTPFGTTRDDPFRTAMTNIQTSKHNMRINKSFPLLVSNGADQAIAYLTGDTFAFKAKGPGKVIKLTKDYMVVEYDSYSVDANKAQLTSGKQKIREIIDLRENIKKNSDGGFYITVKLDTNLKQGSKFKENDILAYDHQVYNTDVGDGKIAFGIGALGNIAYMNTDEGFEDSAIISERLSEALSSQVVVLISKNLPANTNIFKMVEKGTPVQEGDTLLLYQSPFDEEDANALVRQLSLDKKEISEMGRIPIKSKVTGIVQDIKIYRTVEYSEMSPSMKKIVKAYEDKLAPISKEEEKAINKLDLDPTYKLPATSKMKNCEGKIKIEFYLKYNDKMGIGDKLVFMSAIKGETKNIFPEGEEPYTDRVPDEMIDSLCPLPSVLHRMVASVKILTGLYKGVIELTRQMKEAIGLEYIPYNPRKK